MKILFLSFTCAAIGVAMVTNMICQLQESFPLRRAAGSFEIIHKMASRCQDGKVTGDFLDELPNFCDRQIFAIGDHFNCTIYFMKTSLFSLTIRVVIIHIIFCLQ